MQSSFLYGYVNTHIPVYVHRKGPIKNETQDYI